MNYLNKVKIIQHFIAIKELLLNIEILQLLYSHNLLLKNNKV